MQEETEFVSIKTIEELWVFHSTSKSTIKKNYWYILEWNEKITNRHAKVSIISKDVDNICKVLSHNSKAFMKWLALEYNPEDLHWVVILTANTGL